MPQHITPLSRAEAARFEAQAVPSAGSLFFGDDLAFEIAENYKTLRPALSAREVLAATDRTPWGSRVVRYRLVTGNGKAARAEQGTASLPTVGLGATRPEVPYVPFGVLLAWEDAEQEAMLAARANGVRLPDLYGELTAEALRALDEWANAATWDGDGDDLVGLLKSPFSKSPAGIAIAEGTAATGEQIVKAILAARNTIFTKTAGMIEPNFVAMGTDAFSYLQTAVYDSASGPATIGEVLAKRLADAAGNPARLLHCVELNAPSALGGKPAILVGRRDPQVAFVERSAPRFYQIHSPDGGVSYRQAVLAKISGVALPHPDAYALVSNSSNL
jgi:hypothetical protein